MKVDPGLITAPGLEDNSPDGSSVTETALMRAAILEYLLPF